MAPPEHVEMQVPGETDDVVASIRKLWETEGKELEGWKNIVSAFKDPLSMKEVPRVVVFCMECVERWGKQMEWTGEQKRKAAEWLIKHVQSELAAGDSGSWWDIGASLIDIVISATRGQVNVNVVVGTCRKLGRKCGCCKN